MLAILLVSPCLLVLGKIINSTINDHLSARHSNNSFVIEYSKTLETVHEALIKHELSCKLRHTLQKQIN